MESKFSVLNPEELSSVDGGKIAAIKTIIKVIDIIGIADAIFDFFKGFCNGYERGNKIGG